LVTRQDRAVICGSGKPSCYIKQFCAQRGGG